MRELVEIVRRVAELERRVASMVRHGTVEAVDTSNGKHVVRLRLGGSDDQPFMSPWVPYGQIAGAMKVHSPPSVGQEMTLISPGGDFRQAFAMPLSWSDENQSPSDKSDEHVLKFGSVTVTIKGDGVKIEVGGHSLELTSDGSLFKGGKIEHDEHLIDKTHVHTNVFPGGGLSGPPP